MGARWWLERSPTPVYVSREIVMHSMGRQKGAVIVTVAFALLFLLGFMAIALDFGHMFVVKDELQTQWILAHWPPLRNSMAPTIK